MKPILSNPRASRVVATTLAMITGIYAALVCVARPADVATALGRDATQTSTLIFEIGLLAAAALLLARRPLVPALALAGVPQVVAVHEERQGVVLQRETVVLDHLLLQLLDLVVRELDHGAAVDADDVVVMLAVAPTLVLGQWLQHDYLPSVARMVGSGVLGVLSIVVPLVTGAIAVRVGARHLQREGIGA